MGEWAEAILYGRKHSKNLLMMLARMVSGKMEHLKGGDKMQKNYLSKMLTIKNLRKMLKTGGIGPWLIPIKVKK